MKYPIVILLSMISLMACDKPKKAKTNGETPATVKSEPVKLVRQDPQPKTITLKEVSRIALVEAKQFLTNAKNKNVDFSEIMPIFDKAQKAYDQGDYKQAQKTAVEVRQRIEALINIK